MKDQSAIFDEDTACSDSVHKNNHIATLCYNYSQIV